MEPVAYHGGELAVQRRAGVWDAAERLGRSLLTAMTPKVIARAAAADLAVLATCGEDGQPWPWLLAGDPGFLDARSEHELIVRPAHRLEAELQRHVDAHPRVGLVGIDLRTRLRVRVNGRAVVEGGALRVAVEEAFSNCPKYVRRRRSIPRAPAARCPGPSLIAAADTFFVATRGASGRLDASHRGGEPGFVEVDGDVLRWSDYPGNNMFQTLGNLAQDERAGLLFIDFDTSATLQVAATCRLLWDGEERAIAARVREIRARPGIARRRWLAV